MTDKNFRAFAQSESPYGVHNKVFADGVPSEYATPVDWTTLPFNFVSLNSERKEKLKKKARALLALQQQGRTQVVIGVSEDMDFRSGAVVDQLKKGTAYSVSWDVYVAMKCDGVRSSRTLLLERKQAVLDHSVMFALGTMFPRQR
jgi:hypothetical protein